MFKSASKYTLFRPRGGLNDVLSELERCWSYSENFKRKLIIDTRYGCFFDDFWRYFQPRNESSILRVENYSALNALSCYPDSLQGKLSDWVGEWDPLKKFVDPHTGSALTFDFTKAYIHDVVVHAQPWSGRFRSLEALRRLELSAEVRDAIKVRTATIPSHFVAIHVRNTDYRSNYKEFLSKIKFRFSEKNVVICSDDYHSFQWIEENIGGKTVIRNSRFPDNKGVPLHYIQDESAQSQFDRNIDMLTDLVCMVSADELVCVPISRGQRLSGFSMLAIMLREHPGIFSI